MSWLIFALITPFFYNITTYLEKFLIDKKVKDPIFILVLGGIFASLIGIGILFIHHPTAISLFQLIILTIVATLLTLYVIPFYKALSTDETSQVIPLFQFIPVFVFILSQIFLHEYISERQFIGFLFIICGGYVLGTESVSKKNFKLRPAFWYILLSSFLYALSAILFKFIISSFDFWSAYGYLSMMNIVPSILLVLYKPYRKSTLQEMRIASPTVLTIILVSFLITFLAELSASYAYTLAPTALVTAIGSTQPVFAILTGIVLSLWFPHILREDISKKNLIKKTISISIIFIGVYFIYF